MAHPDHLSALILDGAIDIAQPTDASWIEATRGFDDVLGRTLATCESTPGCRFHDTSVWHNVIDSLKAMPVSPTYADAEGKVTYLFLDILNPMPLEPAPLMNQSKFCIHLARKIKKRF